MPVMIMKKRWLLLILCIALPLLIGGISALLTRSGMEGFDTVQTPPLSPPSLLFPIVWTILFILMGVASYLVLTSDKLRTNALYAYAIQLLLNFVWPILFFNVKNYIAAFLWLILLWVAVLVTTVRFFRIRRGAGILMLPYLAWITFAAYLNLSIALLNR
jgi:tryptophan-rich sensory protein